MCNYFVRVDGSSHAQLHYAKLRCSFLEHRAHGLCDEIPPKLAPTREEEEERRSKFITNMAESLYVAGLHAGAQV